MAIAIEASMGKSIAVVARLEVISVRKLTAAINKKRINKIGRPFSEMNCCPIHSASPVEVNPFASAMPPPNRMSTPHGNFTASCQLSMRSPDRPLGSKHSAIPAVIAIMLSSSCGIQICNHWRVMRHRAVAPNTMLTISSWLLNNPSSFLRRFISGLPPGNSETFILKATLVR